MNYTTDQLELIAVMFRIQYSDKTLNEIFPQLENDPIFNIKLSELEISKPAVGAEYENDIDLRHNGHLICYFSHDNKKFLILNLHHYAFTIDDIVKMLNFEDKI